MKKIIISLAIIGVVAAITLGVTGAWWSDPATSTSNSFHSGTLDLKLANPGTSYSDSITGTFDASNMAPGGTGVTGTVHLKNTGSIDADHVRITSVVNTPSDNGINEPECKAYSGEWKSGFGHGWCCVLPKSKVNGGTVCVNSYGGVWEDTGGSSWHCYAEDTIGFKDGVGGWNDIDKYLEITSIKYDGTEKVGTYNLYAQCAGKYYDFNRNGHYDLDDLEQGAWTKDGCALDNLKPALTSGDHKAFEMTVKLNKDAGNVYQTDKDGIKITFQLNQNVSQ